MRFTALAVALSAASLAPAQTDVISAKAGLIHYTEGSVYLDEKEVVRQNAKFAEMKKDSVLRTGEGRAEVLLAPGSFVRLPEQAGIKMIDTSLTAPRFEVIDGSVMIEAAELDKTMSITIAAGASTLTIRKSGIFRIDMKPAPAVRVFEGELTVENSGKSAAVKEGRQMALNTGGEFVLAKFDNTVGDELYRWSKRRSGYVSMANVAIANRMYTRGDMWMNGMNAGWFYNPYFGMFTCVPMNGFWRSPFGGRFFSPAAAYNMVVAPVYAAAAAPVGFGNGGVGYAGTGMSSPTYNSGFGYSTVDTRSSGGYSGGYSGGSSGGYTGGSSGGYSGGASAAPAGGDGGGMRGSGASAGGGQSSGGGGSRGN